MKAFTAALESMDKPRFSIGQIPPTPGLVDQFFNDSTGDGRRRRDRRARAVERRRRAGSSSRRRRSRSCGSSTSRQRARDRRPQHERSRPTRRCSRSCSSSSLRDLLHAEGQLVKALPKMVEGGALRGAAGCASRRTSRRRGAGRAAEGRRSTLLGATAKAKPCKGMAGLIEEGEEVIDGRRGEGRRRRRSGAHRRGAEGRALRDLRLRHGTDDGRADRPA